MPPAVVDVEEEVTVTLVGRTGATPEAVDVPVPVVVVTRLVSVEVDVDPEGRGQESEPHIRPDKQQPPP